MWFGTRREEQVKKKRENRRERDFGKLSHETPGLIYTVNAIAFQVLHWQEFLSPVANAND